MGALAASRAVAVIVGAAFVWIGVAFGAYALMLAFAPSLGPVESAGATAAILILVPAIAMGISALRAPPPLPVEPEPELAVLSVLAALARRKPLLAVLGAGLFGAADVLWTKPEKPPLPRRR